MKPCARIAPLLSRVADGEAQPAEAAWVARHVQDCTCCGILLARERRLTEVIDAIRDVDVDEAFTGAVMRELPNRFPRRRRDRRGLKLALLAGLTLLGAAFGSGYEPGLGAVLPGATAPALPADVSDPAAGGLISLAQMLMLAVRTVAEAPIAPALLDTAPLLLGLLALGLLAAAACGSALVAWLFVGKPPAKA